MSEMHHDPLTDLDLAKLPPDVQVLAGWLAADGATWRAALPPASALDASVRMLSQAPVEPIDRLEETLVLDDLPPVSPPSVPAPAGGHAGSVRVLTRLNRLATVAATVAVVALFVGVYTLRAPGTNRSRSSAGPTPPSTQSPDTTWSEQSRLDVLTVSVVGGSPVVAPSDPRVVYKAYTQYTDRAGHNTQLVFQRTDDAGATWHTLPIPVTADMGNVLFLVSPLDPHTVILQLYERSSPDNPQGGACPAIFSQPAGSQAACQPQYRSTDGGATWAPLVTPEYHVPHQTLLGLRSPLSGWMGGVAAVLRAQGARLYSAFYCPQGDCVRLVASDDGGATWRTVDDALTAQGVEVQDYAATPTGTTLFAVTSPGAYSWMAPTPLTLWRSDDAGATWRRVGQLPTPYDSGLVTVATKDPAQPLLYLDAPRITGDVVNKMGERDPIRSYLADDLKVSTDGGHSWQSAPATGTPTRLRTYPGLVGTLADGSIVVGCVPDGGTDPYAPAGQDTNNNVTLYAWRLGAPTWRQLTPTLEQGLDTLVITTAGGHQTVWVTNSSLTRLLLPTAVVRGTNIPYVPQGTLYHVLRFRLS